MKIGDKVRFLNETGGGRVAGFRDGNIVLVEDQDGFQVPVLKREVVVVEEEKAYDKQPPSNPPLTPNSKSLTPANSPLTPANSRPEERRGGDRLSAYLAFVPLDIKQPTQTRFEVYLVNDCNYSLRYAIHAADGLAWTMLATDEADPNTSIFISEIGHDQLPRLEHLAIQLIPYKRQKPFMLKPAIDVRLRIDGKKFYRLHTFRENPFFETPAIIYTIVADDRTAGITVVDADELKRRMSGQPADAPSPRAVVRPTARQTAPNAPIVVDLHIGELLDTTAGMSPADILNYQLDVVRNTIEAHKSRRGQQIVFIHGKGEGVLRAAMLRDISRRYKQCSCQDASFQEYGYGATLVTIG